MWTWKSKMAKQTDLAFRTDAANLCTVFEGAAKSESFKQNLVLSLKPGTLQFALPWKGCAQTCKQIVGAAPSLLNQLTPLQKRIYLFSAFVQTKGQRAWQLVANHRVCGCLPRKMKWEEPSPQGNPGSYPKEVQGGGGRQNAPGSCNTLKAD